jgi:DNA-binding CsgD family transcriptional regulator/PAS domain-containing protein
MDDAELISALVGSIYDASLEPELWPSVLSKTANYTPGISASLFVKDANSKNFELHYDSGGIEPYYVQTYKEKYSKIDPMTAVHYFAEVGQPTSIIDLAPHDEFIETRFFKEWAQPQGLVDFIGAAIEKTGTSVGMFGVFRHERHGLADDGARRRIHLLTPHIRRAVALGRAFDLKSSQAATFLTVFDSMAACLFLIDAGGRIVHANAAGYAMLASENVLRAVSGRIEPYEARAAQEFREMFDAAGKGDAALGMRGIAFPILARDGEKYIAHLLPLTSGARGRTGSSFGAAAILLAQKASLATPAIPEVIARTYGLTPTELRVLLAVAEIGGVSEVAEAFGVSETTIKFHLKNLFEKTGARRQADLVRLLAGYATPLTG